MKKQPNNRPFALVIFDGFGLADESAGNAIARAHMPTYQSLLARYPFTSVAAAGAAVGLPEGMSGNSEVGHLTLGAGEVVPSVQAQVAQRMAREQLGQEPVLQKHLAALAAAGRVLHLVGLLSDGGVHSDYRSAIALLHAAQRAGVTVCLHAILDGRDVGRQTATRFLTAYEAAGGTVASVQGRWFAMDRDEHWARIARSYECMTERGPAADSWHEVLAAHYATGAGDETVPPTRLVMPVPRGSEKEPYPAVQDGDGVLFFNVRPDRARQLTRAFMAPSFTAFSRTKISLQCFLTLGHFDYTFDAWGVQPLVEPLLPATTLLAQISHRFPQRRIACIAESEKRAHVTYFFDGRCDTPREGVQYHIVPSPSIPSFDHAPAMAAEAITQKVVSSLASGIDTFILNYANADMVGHTGVLDATITACEELDAQLAVLYEQIVVQRAGTIVLTADHGNAERMLTGDNEPCTTHSTNPVPLVVVGPSAHKEMVAGATGLCDVMGVVLRVLAGKEPPPARG